MRRLGFISYLPVRSHHPPKITPPTATSKISRPRGCGISHTILKVDRIGDYEGEIHAPRFLPQGEKPRHTQ
jgi:hypothetical protein